MGNTRIENTFTSEEFSDNDDLEGIITSIRNFQLRQEISSEGLYNRKYLKAIARIVKTAYGDIVLDRIVVTEDVESNEIFTVRIFQGE